VRYPRIMLNNRVSSFCRQLGYRMLRRTVNTLIRLSTLTSLIELHLTTCTHLFACFHLEEYSSDTITRRGFSMKLISQLLRYYQIYQLVYLYVGHFPTPHHKCLGSRERRHWRSLILARRQHGDTSAIRSIY
jgi:hypothetical protein